MKKFFQFVITPLVLLAIVCVFIYSMERVDSDATNSSIQFIREHMNSKGNVIDYYDEIGVDSIDDLKLFVDGEKVTIEFGKIKLSWYLVDFVTPENQELLKTIGIEMYRDSETGRLRVFWQGEEIERWVH